MGQKIDLKDCFRIIKKKRKILLLIVGIIVICTAISNFFFIKPVYEAQTTIIINNLIGEQAQLTKDDIDYNQLLGETYIPIVKSRRVAQSIKENLNLDIDYEEISESIDIEIISGPVTSITVKSHDNKIAAKIANEVPIVFRNELSQIANVDGVEVIDRALTPVEPISPQKFRNILISIGFSLILGIFIVFLLDYLDNKIKTPEELEKVAETALLGVIANNINKDDSKNEIVVVDDSKNSIVEAYRNIRTNIQFSNLDKNLKTITVTSSRPNEGKSTIISNIGAIFGKLENKKVLIIDCDLRNPNIHRIFGLSNINGLTDVLIENKTFNECIKDSKFENLKILTTGSVTNNPAEILNSNKMKNFLKSIKENFDYIFLDTPPIGIISDAGIVATYSDGVILVAASGEIDNEIVKFSKDRLNKVNANIIGCILNKFSLEECNYNEYYGDYYFENKKEVKRRNKKKDKKE